MNQKKGAQFDVNYERGNLGGKRAELYDTAVKIIRATDQLLPKEEPTEIRTRELFTLLGCLDDIYLPHIGHRDLQNIKLRAAADEKYK